jgi:peptidoglycan/LPS O-acetylase OafA/YrhL
MTNPLGRSGAVASDQGAATGVSLPNPRTPRYQTLDLWRGLACLMIAVLHAAHCASEGAEATNLAGRKILWGISKMGAGVPMFFVISGYCIAATSDSTRRRPSAPEQFFLRRFRRIYPPFWAIAALSLLLASALAFAGQADLVSSEYALIPQPSRLSASQWLGNVTLTETWRHHLFGDPPLKILGPSWTLCYEEQFYAVCGLILMIAPGRFFAGIVVVTLITLAVAPIGGTAIEGFFFDGRWLMFAEGVAVYSVLNYWERRPRGVALFAILLCAVAAYRYGVPGVSANAILRDRLWELIVSTSFGLILAVLHPWDLRTAGARTLRPLAVCGQMCYSLYLVHWPITAVMTTAAYRAGIRGVWPTLLVVAPLTLAASLGASWLFHLVVERRFLNPPVALLGPRPRAVPLAFSFGAGPIVQPSRGEAP